MAYSENPVTAERMLPYLGPLAQGEEVRWRVPPERLRWFAYKVREALYLVHRHPERFPELAPMASRYRISITSSREVLAQLRPETPIECVVGVTHKKSSSMETEVSGSVESIITAWTKRSPSTDKMYFPNADLKPEQLRELYSWTEAHASMFMEVGGAVTMLAYDGELEGLTWTPADLEAV